MITSRQNSKLKTMRRLLRCKGAGALLEGPHLVSEALAAGIALDPVLVTPQFAASAEGRELLARLPHPAEPVEPELLEALADADSPRGIVAAAGLRHARLEELPVTRDGVYLYVDRLQDPGNLGALARTAEAAGCAGLALSPGTVDPYHPRAMRASAGSLLRLPAAVGIEPDALSHHLSRHLAPLSPTWLALEAHGGEDLYTAPLDGTLILALGAEGPGLSPDVAARAGRRLTIPLAPPVESLNATVAAALVLFEIRRRRPGTPAGSPLD